MSLESYIQAMPKVELHLQLEGAMQRDTLLMLADQNELKDQIKRFDKWIKLYHDPDFKKLDELTAMLRSWIQHNDDLVRAIYDVGVVMVHDNIRYAEVGINPLSFVTSDFTFEAFMNAINDGRDRAERAWGVRMHWVMLIPRDDPRRANEVAQWATSATARKGGVVALALVGQESKKVSLDQFERAFRTASKKDVARTAYLTEKDNVDEAIGLLELNAVIDSWGIAESPETLVAMKEQNVALSINFTRALKYGWINKVSDYPISTLVNEGISLTISADMPTLFGSCLSDEYLLALKNELVTLDQIEEIALESLRQSHLPDEEKTSLLALFEAEYDVLRTEHMVEGEAST